MRKPLDKRSVEVAKSQKEQMSLTLAGLGQFHIPSIFMGSMCYVFKTIYTPTICRLIWTAFVSLSQSIHQAWWLSLYYYIIDSSYHCTIQSSTGTTILGRSHHLCIALLTTFDTNKKYLNCTIRTLGL